MAWVGGVVEGKWRQPYLHNNKTRKKKEMYTMVEDTCKQLPITDKIKLDCDTNIKI